MKSISYYLKLLLPAAVSLLLLFTACEEEDVQLPDGTKPEMLIGKWKSSLSHYIASDFSYYKVYEFTYEELLIITEEYQWFREEQEYHYHSADTFVNEWIYDGENIYLLSKWDDYTSLGSINFDELTFESINISGIKCYRADENTELKIPGGVKPEVIFGEWQSGRIPYSLYSDKYYSKTYNFTRDKVSVTIDNYIKDTQSEELLYINSEVICYIDWVYDGLHSLYSFRNKDDYVIMVYNLMDSIKDESMSIDLIKYYRVN